MTFKEKIKEKVMKLQTYKMFVGEDTLYVERDDVLKLLEQEFREELSSSKIPNKSENPTGSDDCISRQAVLKIYDEWFATCNIADKKESPKAKINALPPVTPIRPKGHWIKTELPSRDAHECSECGNLAIFDECRNEEMLTDFCPHCGADMRTSED
jgi:regulator of replication initiation timing